MGMEDAEVRSFTSLLNSLSPDEHARGKQFERIAEWWLTQDPVSSLDVKQVWLWEDWPECPGRDIGIDPAADFKEVSDTPLRSE